MSKSSKQKSRKSQSSSSKSKGNRNPRNSTPDPVDTQKSSTNTAVSGKVAYDAIKSNEIGWWSNSPLYPLAVNVPFNRIYGDPIRMPNSVIEGTTFTGCQEAIPGVMTIRYIPSIGSTVGGSNSPVNRAFTSLYGEIYSKTSGAMQFNQADRKSVV